MPFWAAFYIVGYGVCAINSSQFSIGHFQTMHTCCGCNGGVHVGFLMKKIYIVVEFLPFSTLSFSAALMHLRVWSL